MNTVNTIKRKDVFGWDANGSADGWEQRHGKYTLEVYWSDNERNWKAIVWRTFVNEDGAKIPTIIRDGSTGTLKGAKSMALSMAAELSREDLKAK